MRNAPDFVAWLLNRLKARYDKKNFSMPLPCTGGLSQKSPLYCPKKPRTMMLGEDVRVIDWPNAKALPLLADATPAPPPPVPTRVRD